MNSQIFISAIKQPEAARPQGGGRRQFDTHGKRKITKIMNAFKVLSIPKYSSLGVWRLTTKVADEYIQDDFEWLGMNFSCES